MIIPNGTIELKYKTPSGIDPTTGYPIKASSVWGEAVPCQYLIGSHDDLARTSGEAFVKASYDVLVEQQPIVSEQLRLTDRHGEVLGEFSILSVEQLDAVCQTKILV